VSSSPAAADPATVLGRFVVVPASYVFLLRGPEDGPGTEVLLQRRRNTGFMDDHWAAGAAGHVERGETAPAAAGREALEEIGVEVGDLAFVTAMQRTRGDKPIDERIDFFFSCRDWQGEPRVTEPEKSGGLTWCRLDSLDSLDGPVVPHERAVLEALRDGTATAYSTHGFPEEDPR